MIILTSSITPDQFHSDFQTGSAHFRHLVLLLRRLSGAAALTGLSFPSDRPLHAFVLFGRSLSGLVLSASLGSSLFCCAVFLRHEISRWRTASSEKRCVAISTVSSGRNNFDLRSCFKLKYPLTGWDCCPGCLFCFNIDAHLILAFMDRLRGLCFAGFFPF